MSSIEDSTGPDIGREEQISEEWEQRDRNYQDWLARTLALLSALYQPPWNDAGPENQKISSDGEGSPGFPAAGEGNAA